MSRICRCLLLAGLAGSIAMGPAAADTLLIDALRDADREARDLPRHGATMERVEQHFGEPQERRPAVGEPPITRWDYEGYSVYFEHDRVLRTVQRRQ